MTTKKNLKTKKSFENKLNSNLKKIGLIFIIIGLIHLVTKEINAQEILGIDSQLFKKKWESYGADKKSNTLPRDNLGYLVRDITNPYKVCVMRYNEATEEYACDQTTKQILRNLDEFKLSKKDKEIYADQLVEMVQNAHGFALPIPCDVHYKEPRWIDQCSRSSFVGPATLDTIITIWENRFRENR